MSSYIAKMLMPNEKIVAVGVLHWIIYVYGLVLTGAGGLLACATHPLLAFVFGDDMASKIDKPALLISLVIVVMGIYRLIIVYMRQTTTEIVVTDARVIIKFGVWTRTTYEVLINRISGTNFYQTFGGRVFGYGTILVHGVGGDVTPIVFLANPHVFYKGLLGVIESHNR